MDINYLLHREQVERMRADRAACEESRDAHSALAESYRSRIDGHRLCAETAGALRRAAN